MNNPVHRNHYYPVTAQKQFVSGTHDCLFFARKISYNSKIVFKKTQGSKGHNGFPCKHENNDRPIYVQKSEDILTKYCDNLYGEFIKIINARTSITIEQKLYIMFFIVKLAERNPNSQKLTQKLIKESCNHDSLVEFVKNSAMKLKFSVTEETIGGYVETLDKFVKTYDFFNNKICDFRISTYLTNLFLENKRWVLIYNHTAIPFISSDNPIVREGNLTGIPLSKKIFFSTMEFGEVFGFNHSLSLPFVTIDSTDEKLVHGINMKQVSQYRNEIIGGETDELLRNYLM